MIMNINDLQAFAHHSLITSDYISMQIVKIGLNLRILKSVKLG